MYIENNIIYSDDYKVLYKRSTNSLVGKSAELLFTFWGANGERLAKPQYEDESYFYEKFDVSELQQSKIDEINDYAKSEELNSIIFNGETKFLTKERRAELLRIAEVKKSLGEEVIHFWYEGEQIALPLDVVIGILLKWESYEFDVQNIIEGHIEAVKALEDGEAINAYDYRSNYPEKPEIAFEMDVPEEKPVEEGEETTPEESAPEDDNNGSSFDPWWWLRK